MESVNFHLRPSGQDGGVDISSFDEDEAGCSFNLVSEGNVREI